VLVVLAVEGVGVLVVEAVDGGIVVVELATVSSHVVSVDPFPDTQKGYLLLHSVRHRGKSHTCTSR